ncbi:MULTISPECIES: DUF502 domain-containing protein [Snodgrassella]|uniref:DUF502 domain-containing protein n=1 Tax=Snodgrassella TaxID=1193515 RepID=UPI002269BAA1|nr:MULTISPECIES: DUF502 domain-containing protein [unclassified Snodgrassella]MCX8745958.1 DUF502 domain-containing protein [Snodgrassella sp. B3800]MCX8748288.1 DUF502 domain-containing protein [Snodgrassella sp. B3088]MCX8752726.1 DUF502 domain-containing protein [Snodgrassella sp. B3837]
MAPQPAEGGKLKKSLKKYMLTGVLVWLPIIVTIWVISYIIGMADELVNILPARWQPQALFGFKIHGLGLVAAIIVVFFTGLLAANMLGRKIFAAWDALWGRIPVVKSIYSGVKKVSESLLSDSRQSFKTPVLIPFPQPNIWTIGFVSGHIPDNIASALPKQSDATQSNEYISVYVPTTPNPTGGYYIMVNSKDVREIDMSVDDALKYVISLGMVQPDEPPHNQSLQAIFSLHKPARPN